MLSIGNNRRHGIDGAGSAGWICRFNSFVTVPDATLYKDKD